MEMGKPWTEVSFERLIRVMKTGRTSEHTALYYILVYIQTAGTEKFYRTYNIFLPRLLGMISLVLFFMFAIQKVILLLFCLY